MYLDTQDDNGDWKRIHKSSSRNMDTVRKVMCAGHIVKMEEIGQLSKFHRGNQKEGLGVYEKAVVEWLLKK